MRIQKGMRLQKVEEFGKKRKQAITVCFLLVVDLGWRGPGRYL